MHSVTAEEHEPTRIIVAGDDAQSRSFRKEELPTPYALLTPVYFVCPGFEGYSYPSNEAP